eukprot:3157483-Pyramimonas_sp.AAC.1
MPLLELFLGRGSTLGVLRKGPGSGTSARAPRGHLWSRLWSSFERCDYEAHKALAHAPAVD